MSTDNIAVEKPAVKTRKEKRAEERVKLEQEEAELMGKYQRNLAKLYMDQKKVVEDEQDYREKLRANYKKQADERKYKHRLAVRHQNRKSIEVLDSMNEYGAGMLAMYTDDPVLYAYQRRLRSELQWAVLKGLPVGIMFANLPLWLARQMKKRGMLDIPLYFGMPLCYWIYSKSLVTQTQLFELGYPAHPVIIERRRRAINKACFFAPSMLKNEIQYMHGKITGVRTPEELAKLLEQNKEDSHRYEKEFQTGSVGLSMIMSKENKKKKEGKKFRVIVEHGELYLECIDSFEEIFEISQEYVTSADKRVELTDVLDPYLFENHRDIVNALFEVYYDVSENYLKLHDEESSKAINNAAKESVSRRFGLDSATEREVVAKRSMNEVRDMIRETRDMKKN